jgi:hypothetical protein
MTMIKVEEGGIANLGGVVYGVMISGCGRITRSDMGSEVMLEDGGVRNWSMVYWYKSSPTCALYTLSSSFSLSLAYTTCSQCMHLMLSRR